MKNDRMIRWVRETLLGSGIAASCIYVGADLWGARHYPGYSLADQAVSELFAVGAPTGAMVTALFSLSSVMLLLFAAGVALSARGMRALHLTAGMFAASAVDALVLWNAFPMHMRGSQRTFTDAMHLLLSVNPFVWLAIFPAMAAISGWFRVLSIVGLIVIVTTAAFAFQFARPWP